MVLVRAQVLEHRHLQQQDSSSVHGGGAGAHSAAGSAGREGAAAAAAGGTLLLPFGPVPPGANLGFASGSTRLSALRVLAVLGALRGRLAHVTASVVASPLVACGS